MKYRSYKTCFIGLPISLYLVGMLLWVSCQSEDPATIGTPVEVPISITLGGVSGYSSGLDDAPTANTRATTPMATGTKFRVVALQRNRIAGQADYTVTASGVSADGVTMRLLPGKYKFVAYSFNTTTSLAALNDEGTVPVTNATDLLFAQDTEEIREVGTDPVSLSFTFIPQRARVRVEMANVELGTFIISPGTVKLAGSFSTGASFSLAGGMFFGYTGLASSYTFTFSDVAGTTRTSNTVYVLPTSGTSTVSVAGATVLGYIPYSGSGTLPALLPGKEYVYMQTLGVTAVTTGLSGANCFIVTKEGKYAIDASIKGNGKQVKSTAVTGTAADVPATAEEVNITGGSSAELLWETFNTTTAPTADNPVVKDVAYDATKKQITFTTTANEGNAVIALKDASGNILWSWHIWRINTTPAAQPLAAITGLAVAGELVIMDRNLGALSATAQSDLSMGLLYQWGRKDPFTNSVSFSSSIDMSVRGQDISMAAGNDSKTPADAVKNPTVFYTSNSGNYDWTSCNDNLWGTPMGSAISLNSRPYNTNKGSKTIYDPCPVGWRVPLEYAFHNAIDGNAGFNKGYIFSAMCTTLELLWFPAAGYRSNGGGSLSNVGMDGYNWTSSPTAVYTSDGSSLDFGSRGVIPANSHFRSFGQSVRCSRE